MEYETPRSLILDPCLCLVGDYLVIPTMGLGEDLLELCPGIEQANQTDGLLGCYEVSMEVIATSLYSKMVKMT